jgi:hypothetical protein
MSKPMPDFSDFKERPPLSLEQARTELFADIAMDCVTLRELHRRLMGARPTTAEREMAVEMWMDGMGIV